jgi:hypothetical protein
MKQTLLKNKYIPRSLKRTYLLFYRHVIDPISSEISVFIVSSVIFLIDSIPWQYALLYAFLISVGCSIVTTIIVRAYIYITDKISMDSYPDDFFNYDYVPKAPGEIGWPPAPKYKDTVK